MVLSIGLVTGGLEFDGNSLKTQPLGGSETAFLCMARELVKLGCRVTAFCNTKEIAVIDGVNYQNVETFSTQMASLHFDVLIVSRYWDALDAPLPAKLRFLWCHDIMPPENAGIFAGHLWQTDEVWLLSKFHISNYVASVPKLESIIWQTKNGLDLELIDENLRPKISGKCLFTSRPERGLLPLLTNIWPRILKERPDAKLFYANYGLQGMQIDERSAQLIQQCEIVASQFRGTVIPLGHLSKQELYQHMSSAELLLYPTAFPEISCITAMEAQACQTPIITTDDFALTETVGPGGVLIKGLPHEQEYCDTFVQEAVSLLANKVKRHKVGKAGRKWIEDQGYNWEAIAKTWLERIETKFRERWEMKSEKVCTALIKQNDPEAARALGFGSSLNEVLDAVTEKRFGETVVSNEDKVNEFKAATFRFSKAMSLFGLVKVPTKQIVVLDFQPGLASFGIYLKKACPEARVVVYEPRLGYRKDLSNIAEASGLDIEFLVQSPFDQDEKYDVIFLDRIIERSADPSMWLDPLVKIASEDCRVLGSAQVDFRQHEQPSTRRNFDIEDLKGFFSKDESVRLTMALDEDSDFFPNGHWLFSYDPHTTVINTVMDLEAKKRTRPYQKIAGCMIVRNESPNLARCLQAARPHLDGLFIADGHSTDDTIQIAERFSPTEIISIPTTQEIGFGPARNLNLDMVPDDFDWVFWFDADEVMTEGKGLRRYLNTEFFNGLVVPQCHLMLDAPPHADLPVRVFKLKPHFRFTGYIHEHCEDISENAFDMPISPALSLPDVKLAHYGYVNETLRRDKCSNRNIELLQRDLEDHPERMLNYVLLMRDLINIAKWAMAKNTQISKGSPIHQRLCEAVSIYLDKFVDNKHRFHKLAYPVYQEALMRLSMVQLPYMDRTHPPFCSVITLAGHYGAAEEKVYEPEKVWFLDGAQLEQSLVGKSKELLVGLGILDPSEIESDKKHWTSDYQVPSVGGGLLNMALGTSPKTRELWNG